MSMDDDYRNSELRNHGNPPSECQWRGCGKSPEMFVVWTQPGEIVYYCVEHYKLAKRQTKSTCEQDGML